MNLACFRHPTGSRKQRRKMGESRDLVEKIGPQLPKREPESAGSAQDMDAIARHILEPTGSRKKRRKYGGIRP